MGRSIYYLLALLSAKMLRCPPPNKSFHFSKNFFFKRIDKIQFFCYTIYVIKRTTGWPACSWLPEETAVKKRNSLVAQLGERPLNAGTVMGSSPIQLNEIWVSISRPPD